MVAPFRSWPYAALAVITHQWDTDHLDMVVVFRHPMDQTIKPANALWKVKVDSVVKTVTASAWTDEWTMALTVGAVAALPTTVTLEYDGPSPLLTTTWEKQWEPWGPILSTDSSPLPIGSYYGNEIAWSQVAAQNVWYTVSDTDIVSDIAVGETFQNNQELKVGRAGYYLVTYYITLECTIANKHVLAAPELNGTEQLAGRNHIEFGRANEETSISGSAIFLLALDDLVSVGISTPDAGNPTLSVDHIGLTVTELRDM